MKRIAGVFVIAALTSVSLVAVATAHTVRHDSTVTFQVETNGQDADTFEGKVRSDSDRCAGGQLVHIHRAVTDGPDVVVGEDITNANGKYSAPAGDAWAGTYYAVVIRKVLRKDSGHRHVCKSAVSPERVVAGP